MYILLEKVSQNLPTLTKTRNNTFFLILLFVNAFIQITRGLATLHANGMSH